MTDDIPTMPHPAAFDTDLSRAREQLAALAETLDRLADTYRWLEHGQLLERIRAARRERGLPD